MDKYVHILDLPFHHITKEKLLNQLQQNIKAEKKTFIVTANPEIAMYAHCNLSYKKIVKLADHIIADGIGIIYGAKILKTPLPERIAGFDLMVNLLELANREQLRVYFLGARENVITQTVENVQRDYPKLKIAGYHHGFFATDDEQIVNKVKETQPDLVFVALGFPKQEEWIHRHYDEFQKGIFIGVGGSFDILAGAAKRAPDFWIKLHLEWLHRLLMQPTRWKRMLVLPKFIIEVWKQRLGR